jgi:hypothetical protein
MEYPLASPEQVSPWATPISVLHGTTGNGSGACVGRDVGVEIAVVVVAGRGGAIHNLCAGKSSLAVLSWIVMVIE